LKPRIAPELDSLMWTLVEKGNDRAIDEFLARYPELKPEVVRRTNMVSGLKKMKAPADAAVEPPPFRQVDSVRYAPPRRTLYVVGALALAALGVASFTVTYIVLPKPEPIRPAIKQTIPPPKLDKFDKDAPLPYTDPATTAPGPDDEAPIVGEAPPWSKPIGVKLSNAPMHSVFKLIEAQSGLKIEIAPGTPNPNVEVAYGNMTALEILRDMGHEHGFTPLEQENGLVIIVPAVDSEESTRPPKPIGAEGKDLRHLNG
jgi:hypothetical protein